MDNPWNPIASPKNRMVMDGNMNPIRYMERVFPLTDGIMIPLMEGSWLTSTDGSFCFRAIIDPFFEHLELPATVISSYRRGW